MIEDKKVSYTNIQHVFRNKYNLSCVEYVLCDMIFYLSQDNEKSAVPGWCYKSKENLAKDIGLSKQAILNMIERLIEAGFIIKNNQTKHLKTTEKWQSTYFTSGKETLPINGKETLLPSGKETLPYNNTLNNNTVNKDPTLLLKNKKNKFFKQVMAWKIANPNKFPNRLYDEFFKHWTEQKKNGDGEIRLDDEKFFDIGKRMATFKKFTKPEELNKMWEDHYEDAKKIQQPTLNFTNDGSNQSK